jgi:hypothetical protein
MNNNNLAALLYEQGQVGKQCLSDGFYTGNFFCHNTLLFGVANIVVVNISAKIGKIIING